MPLCLQHPMSPSRFVHRVALRCILTRLSSCIPLPPPHWSLAMYTATPKRFCHAAGTGVLFDVAFAPAPGAAGPGAGAGTSGSNPSWTTTLLVNGSAPPATATPVTNGVGVVGLPHGRHEFSLQLSRNSGAEDTWARVEGVQCTMGGLISATTSNTTIDDSAWANGSIALSPNWNMLEQGKSNYINEASC